MTSPISSVTAGIEREKSNKVVVGKRLPVRAVFIHSRQHTVFDRTRAATIMGCISSREHDPDTHKSGASKTSTSTGRWKQRRGKSTVLTNTHHVRADLSPSSPTWWSHGGPPPLFHFSAAANRAQARDALTYGRGATGSLQRIATLDNDKHRGNGGAWLREGTAREWDDDEIDGERERAIDARTVSRIKHSDDSGLDTGSHAGGECDGPSPHVYGVCIEQNHMSTRHEYYGDGTRPLSDHLYAVCADNAADEGIAPSSAGHYEEIDEVESTTESPTDVYAPHLAPLPSTTGHDYRSVKTTAVSSSAPRKGGSTNPFVNIGSTHNLFEQGDDYITVESA